ncbi:molybdenum ABC transporter ATP-binding protein [Chelativorans sp. ZYF759]|uniref:molybdenum ABC transporter ATP-binding protein n=1 Tax=Chelativorans sp. ZYF759 TaxID=2692213 RepID=UPI00145C61E2|nr:molybdenum ABC transporter ATP-binding protein [Chelativorans sp. ZYF759]NMG39370.1 molybdenum ABC transporter ATP-binding protein [Chelativorans sp. ZYF759]
MALEVMARATTPIPLDIAFRVEPGELLALVGHSGSGKSTMLRTIAGLWSPTEARVSVNGETWLDTSSGIDLAPHRRRVGIVFQSYALFPHMSALANVMAAMGHLPSTDRQGRARELLGLVNLEGLEARKPATLSGGQQQRVAVARALAREPSALLLDEPFSAVDRATRDRLYEEIRQLRAHLAMPTVLVTHDLEEARLLADRMVVIEDGRVAGAGSTAEIMSDPVALRAMGLRELGSGLPAVIEAQEDDELTRLRAAAGPVWLPRVEGEPGTAVSLRIMAHDVIIAREKPAGISALNMLPATVTAIDGGDGPGVIVRLDVGGSPILAQLTARSVRVLALAPGTPCFAVVKSMAVARDDVRADPAT